MTTLQGDTPTEDTIYYSLRQTNDTKIPVKASYRTTLASPLVDKASSFRGSIIRFSVPGSAIPLLVWRNDYYISFRNYNPAVASPPPRNVALISNVDPTEVNTIPETKNYVYDYLTIANSINRTLALLYADYKTLNPGFPATQPPWIDFDVEGQKFIMYAEPNYYASAARGGTIEIAFNCRLAKLFPNFLVQYRYFLGSSAAPTIDDCWRGLYFEETGSNIPSSQKVPYYVDSKMPTIAGAIPNPQSYSALSEVLDIKGIMITSNSIQSRPEIIPSASIANVGLPNTLSTIADFVALSGNGNDLLGGIVYNPTAEFRYFDLLGDGEIRTVDFSVFWYSGNYDVYPLLLNPGEVYTIKLMLQRKHPDAAAVMPSLIEAIQSSDNQTSQLGTSSSSSSSSSSSASQSPFTIDSNGRIGSFASPFKITRSYNDIINNK